MVGFIANIGSFVSQNIPHHTPFAVKLTFHRYLYPTEHKNRSPPVVCYKCPFFSLFHAPINAYVNWLRLPSLLHKLYTMPSCLLRKIYSSPTHLCASEHCILFFSFSTVHSPQHHIAHRGLSTCSYKIRHISLAVSHREQVSCSFDAYWTTKHDRVWE